MLTQMIKLRGGRVIARVSREDKAEIARGPSFAPKTQSLLLLKFVTVLSLLFAGTGAISGYCEWRELCWTAAWQTKMRERSYLYR